MYTESEILLIIRLINRHTERLKERGNQSRLARDDDSTALYTIRAATVNRYADYFYDVLYQHYSVY